MLHRHIYVSAARRPLAPAELAELLDGSRRRNAAIDVTGLMLYHDGSILQILEGPEDKVQTLFRIIRDDPRHRQVITMASGPIEARELPSEEEKGGQEGRVVLSGALATLPLREAREAFEREYLLTQINRFGGNISRTAAFVGMERSALHRKLKSLGVVTSTKSGTRIAHVDEDAVEAAE